MTLHDIAIEAATRAVGNTPRPAKPYTAEQVWEAYALAAVTAFQTAMVLTTIGELDALPSGSIIMCVKKGSNPDWPELFLNAGSRDAPWLALDPSDRDDGEVTLHSGTVLRWHGEGSVTVLRLGGPDYFGGSETIELPTNALTDLRELSVTHHQMANVTVWNSHLSSLLDYVDAAVVRTASLEAENKRLKAIESRLTWLATKPDRTKDIGQWWGNEIDACLQAMPTDSLGR